jgi:alpha-beta hydrolase superfamily lysophospholipase
MPSSTTRRAARTGAAAAAVGIPLAAAYGFAVEYRRRAGFPKPRPLVATPGDDGLPWESLAIPSPGGALPAWFIPACGGAPGPGVVLVHGWESSRARMLPNARFLHAAGFHTLLLDVRGHGENPPEVLPISGGEFGADAAAAVAVLRGRPEVTSVGLLGHSMGAVGAVLAAASEPGIAALVATAIPAHPRLLTRRTFELAGLRIPGPVAAPLAWLTLHVYLRPRGRRPGRVNALRAIGAFPGPLLVVHGSADEIVPLRHAELLLQAARVRSDREAELLVVPGGRHSWLYESPAYRARVAAFFATHLGGPYPPSEAAVRAAAMAVARPPERDGPPLLASAPS